MWAPPELSDPTTQTEGKTWAEEMDLRDPLDEDKFNARNSATLKYLPLIYHNVCLSHANKGQLTLWAEVGQVPIDPTTQGRGRNHGVIREVCTLVSA